MVLCAAKASFEKEKNLSPALIKDFIDTQDNMTAYTALMAAAFCGNLTAVKALVRCGACQVSKDCRGNTALMLAIGHSDRVGREECALWLIRNGVAEALSIRANDGDSPLDSAMYFDSKAISLALLHSGADATPGTGKGQGGRYRRQIVSKRLFFDAARLILNVAGDKSIFPEEAVRASRFDQRKNWSCRCII